MKEPSAEVEAIMSASWPDRSEVPPEAMFDVYDWNGVQVCGYNEAGDAVCELPFEHEGEHEWTGEVAAARQADGPMW